MGSRGMGRPVLLPAMVAVLVAGSVALARAQADFRAQWARSKHANRELARLEATVEKRGPMAAHCGRCHAEQGYLAWLPQLESGNPGLITRPDGSPADEAYLSNLGLNRFSVRPVTCAACHQANFKLRVTATTPVLPAGFRAVGVGLGAQCMTCHNTRNGAITWNAPDPRRYTAPHTSAQADVLMGKNAFFVPPAEATMYHYDAKTALEELQEDAILPHPVHLRDMILRARLPAELAVELNRDFQQYIARYGEIQKLAATILDRLSAVERKT